MAASGHNHRRSIRLSICCLVLYGINAACAQGLVGAAIGADVGKKVLRPFGMSPSDSSSSSSSAAIPHEEGKNEEPLATTSSAAVASAAVPPPSLEENKDVLINHKTSSSSSSNSRLKGLMGDAERILQSYGHQATELAEGVPPKVIKPVSMTTSTSTAATATTTTIRRNMEGTSAWTARSGGSAGEGGLDGSGSNVRSSEIAPLKEVGGSSITREAEHIVSSISSPGPSSFFLGGSRSSSSASSSSSLTPSRLFGSSSSSSASVPPAASTSSSFSSGTTTYGFFGSSSSFSAAGSSDTTSGGSTDSSTRSTRRGRSRELNGSPTASSASRIRAKSSSSSSILPSIATATAVGGEGGGAASKSLPKQHQQHQEKVAGGLGFIKRVISSNSNTGSSIETASIPPASQRPLDTEAAKDKDEPKKKATKSSRWISPSTSSEGREEIVEGGGEKASKG